MRKPGISLKIIIIISLSFIVVEGLILGFTGTNRREELVGHYVFEASIITLAVDPIHRNDSGYLNDLAERLSAEKVLNVRPSAENETESWVVDNAVLVYRNHGVEVEIDVSEVPALVRVFAFNVIGLVGLILVSLVATSFFFMRLVLVRPLHELLSNLNAISGSGADLTARLKVRSHDEIGRIAESFNLFAGRIQGVIGKMKEASDTARQIGIVLMKDTGDSSVRLQAVSEAATTNGTRIEGLNHEIQDAAAAINQISASTQSMTAPRLRFPCHRMHLNADMPTV